MAHNFDFYCLLFTNSVYSIVEAALKRILFLVFVSLALSACQKANNLVIDSSQQIVNATQLTFVGEDSIDIAGNINSHPPGLTITDSFSVTLNPVEGFSYLDVKVENDSNTVVAEQSFSTLQGNSVTGNFSFAPASVYVGTLTYKFTPYDSNGAAGNYMVKTVQFYNSAASPPVIDTVIAPDSVQVNSSVTGIVDFYAKVHDPFGLNDVGIVYFNTTQPDGSPSTHNPYHLFDDGGASGDPTDNDQVPNDGTFSYEGQLPPGTTTGIYTFTFYAVNRSGVESLPVVHKMRVYK